MPECKSCSQGYISTTERILYMFFGVFSLLIVSVDLLFDKHYEKLQDVTQECKNVGLWGQNKNMGLIRIKQEEYNSKNHILYQYSFIW